MKRIEATFRPAAFGAVKAALQTLGIEVINLSRSEDMRRRRSDAEVERRDTSHSMVRIELIVTDTLVTRVRDVIVATVLRPSPIESSSITGKILISSLDEAIDLSAVVRDRDASHCETVP